MNTRKLPESRRPSLLKADPQLAAGLHVPAQGSSHLFEKLRNKGARTYILIGRRKTCHIRIDDLYMSAVHAVIERLEHDAYRLSDCQSRNRVFVDGELLIGPIILHVGMRIEVGRTLLIATDARGAIPVEATSIKSFVRHAVTLYGNNSEASRHIGLSRETIRRRLDKDRAQ